MTAGSIKQKQPFAPLDPASPKRRAQIFADDSYLEQDKFNEEDYWYDNWYDEEDGYADEESNRLSPSQAGNRRFENFKWIQYKG